MEGEIAEEFNAVRLRGKEGAANESPEKGVDRGGDRARELRTLQRYRH
jgi:hypothetical protein